MRNNPRLTLADGVPDAGPALAVHLLGLRLAAPDADLALPGHGHVAVLVPGLSAEGPAFLRAGSPGTPDAPLAVDN